MTDVDEVVGTETGSDLEEVPFVEPPNRFDKIKESYKGVTSALDLSEETAAYEDFQSLLTDNKVMEFYFFALTQCISRKPWFLAARACLMPHRATRMEHHHPYMSFWYLG